MSPCADVSSRSLQNRARHELHRLFPDSQTRSATAMHEHDPSENPH